MSDEQRLHRDREEALKAGEELAHGLMPALAAIRYSDKSPNIIFWAAFLAGLFGVCAAQIGRNETEAVFAEMKRVLDTSPLGETKQ